MLQSLTYKTINFLVAAFLLFGLVSCGNNKGEEPDQPTPRTVLVYMAANCNLGRDGYDNLDLDEMLLGVRNGALGRGRLLVYHAAYRETPILKEVTTEGIINLKEYTDEASSLDIERMREVITDVKSNAPAESYGIVFWSHGTAWRESSGSRSSFGIEGSRSITDSEEHPICYSYGSDNGVEMKITSLAKALEGQWFDFVYFDVCHLATIETAYELRHIAPILVGSTTELDLLGMPYHLNLSCMFAATPDMTGAAANTLQYYVEHPRYGCSMSVINLNSIDRLARATKALYESGAKLPDDYRGIPYYRVTVPCIVYDFGDYIRNLRSDDNTVSESLMREWEQAYSETVVYKNSTTECYGFNMTEFTGLGSYIMQNPADSLTNGYYNQSWFKDVARYSIKD